MISKTLELEPKVLEEILAEMVHAAKTVGLLQLKYFGTKTAVRLKPDNTPVSQVDKEAEHLLARMLRERFPEFGCYGEEGTRYNADNDIKFVIDPLDGTRSFAAGIPTFACIIAFVSKNTPILGVIHHPALGITHAGGPSVGCARNGQRVMLAKLGPLVENDIVVASTPRMFKRARREQVWQNLQQLHPNLRIYNDSFGHTLVLQNSVRACCETTLEPWDILATQALVEGAGGLFRTIPADDHSFAPVYIFGAHDVVEYLRIV